MSIKLFFLFFLFTSLQASNFIRVGYDLGSANTLSKKDMTLASDIWITEIASDIGFKAVTTAYEDPAEMAKDFMQGNLDYIASSGFIFVKYFNLSLLEDGFSQGYLNGEKETFIFLVNKKSNIKRLQDITTQQIAIQRDDKIISLYLQNRTKDEKTLNIQGYKTRQRALLKLFFGKVEVAVSTNKSFDLAIELNPQIGKEIKVLHTTGLQATAFGFFSKSFNEESKQKLLNTTKNIHKTPKGRQLLTLYKTEIITTSKIEELKPFKELYEKNQYRKKTK